MDPLTTAYRLCDPAKVAQSEEYVDCSEVRGGNPFVKKVTSKLSRSGERDFETFLFAGHTGGGKSSELAELSRRLAEYSHGEVRYIPINVDVNEYLDISNSSIVDLLLAIVVEIAESLRSLHGIELRESWASGKARELLGLLTSKISLENLGLSVGAPELAGAHATIKLLRVNDVERINVRNALDPKKPLLRDAINEVLDRATGILSRKLGRPVALVVIVDNLEKLEMFDAKKGSLASQRELFLQQSSLLNGYRAHLVYTMALDIARGEAVNLRSRYSNAPSVLPLIKVSGPCQPDQRYDKGYVKMRELLHKRLSIGGLSLSDVIELDALDELIRASGGNVRSYMTLLRDAISSSTDGGVVRSSDARRAVQEMKATYSTTILQRHWKPLADLELSKNAEIRNGDEDYLKLLEQHAVLEYINGEYGRGDEPWYSVHPLVRELSGFKDEVERLRGQGVGA